MTDERKERIATLKKRLAHLTETEREAFASKGLIATVEGRTLSPHNTMLVYLQSNGRVPTVVGGYQQWKRAGKQVQKGEHGMMIWFPLGEKDADSGDILAASRFFCGTVFDISQVQEAQG